MIRAILDDARRFAALVVAHVLIETALGRSVGLLKHPEVPWPSGFLGCFPAAEGNENGGKIQRERGGVWVINCSTTSTHHLDQ